MYYYVRNSEHVLGMHVLTFALHHGVVCTLNCMGNMASIEIHMGCILLLIGASLSEPHTSVTALQDACVCLSAYVRPYTENFN